MNKSQQKIKAKLANRVVNPIIRSTGESINVREIAYYRGDDDFYAADIHISWFSKTPSSGDYFIDGYNNLFQVVNLESGSSVVEIKLIR